MVELRENQRNAEQQEKNEKELKQYATDHPLGAFALARGSKLAGGFTGLAELYYQRDNKYGYDTNAAVIDRTIQDNYDLEIPVPGNKNEDSNSTDKDDQGNSIDLFDFAYNVGAGVIDNGLRIAIGGGNSYGAGAVMFSQVTTSSLIEGKEKGYSDEKALGMALGSAGFEALAEKMSWDRILKGGNGPVKNMTNGFFAEGTEGVNVNWMNRGMDQVVNGEYSELSKTYQEALAGNLSEEEAWNKVFKQIAAEDAGTFIEEGTVGAVLGTDVYMYNKISGTESAEANTDKEVPAQENADAAREMKEETSGQTVEQAEDSGYNTTKSKETLEEVEKIEDNGGEGSINTIDSTALLHSSVGDFTYDPKTGAVSKMKGGGHGQANIDFLEANGMEYNIVYVYDNGVRIGNVPDHKVKDKRTGTNQSWFPDNWSETDIANAGNYVGNLAGNVNVADGVAVFGEYNGVRVGVIRTNGKISTIFPDATSQP